MRRICTVEGCGRLRSGRGLCDMHWKRVVRANGKFPRVTVEERFWGRVVKTDSCWLWQGAPMSSGYGQLQVNGKTVLVHRFSYEKHIGPIPEGMVVDHLCRTPLCVNPEHLEAVTDYENRRRGLRSPEAPTCINGHARSPQNIYVDPRGHKGCRICRREQSRAAAMRRRSA